MEGSQDFTRLFGRRRAAAQELKRVLHDEIAGGVGIILFYADTASRQNQGCGCGGCAALSEVARLVADAYQSLRKTVNAIADGATPASAPELQLLRQTLRCLTVSVTEEDMQVLGVLLPRGQLRELRLALQELFINARKHARPRHIRLTCRQLDGDHLRLTIMYDGPPPPSSAAGHGTASLFARLSTLDASFEARKLGAFAKVVIVVPLGPETTVRPLHAA